MESVVSLFSRIWRGADFTAIVNLQEVTKAYWSDGIENGHSWFFNMIHVRESGMIIPCFSGQRHWFRPAHTLHASFLSLMYWPRCCGILHSLFQLLLMELVPSTSIVTPLIGKYLLFTCILVSISVITSVFVLNLTQRTSSTHTMPSFVRSVFINSLPRLLCMQRPVEAQRADVDFSQAHSELLPFDNPYKKVTHLLNLGSFA